MKKKIQKPFSIEEWENGAKVETRSGRSVRMLCTDLKDNYPIVAAITVNDGTECSCIFDADGHFCTGSETDSDLVIIEEVEESRWADDKETIGEGWYIGCYCKIKHGMYTVNDEEHHDVFATEKQAKSALAMARISQLMAHDERYGGVVTDVEWRDMLKERHIIYRKHSATICVESLFTSEFHFLAFHTEEQRDLFLAENDGERLEVAYSGGKDSDLLLFLARQTLAGA